MFIHTLFIMPPPLIGGGIKRWCASDVFRVHRA